MTEKESLIQEKLKDKEYCDVLSEVRRLLACWYGADVIPEKKRAEFKERQPKSCGKSYGRFWVTRSRERKEANDNDRAEKEELPENPVLGAAGRISQSRMV